MPLKGEFNVSKQEPAVNTNPDKTLLPMQKEGKHKDSKGHTVVALDKTAIKRQSIGILSSYCPYPEGVTFENQDEDEEIILFLRRHFITNFYWITGSILLLFLPPFIIPLLTSVFPTLVVPPSASMAFIAFYYLVVFGFALMRFSNWYFHATVVTNKRVVDVDIHNILNKDVSEAYLDVIQDVSYNQKGVLQSFFNFGDIHIQTEAVQLTLEIDACPKPGEVSRIISDLVEEAKEELYEP